MGDDDRPKKSWREIDSQRDRSGGGSGRRRSDPEERLRERASKSAAYSKYKANLDQLFTPGGQDLPESLKAQLGPTTETSKKQRALTDALVKSPNATTLAEYLEGAEQPLPEDPRLLMSLLDVSDESLLVPVLSALLGVVEAGKKPNRMLLLQKLEALTHRIEEDETIELVKTLRAALD